MGYDAAPAPGYPEFIRRKHRDMQRRNGDNMQTSHYLNAIIQKQREQEILQRIAHRQNSQPTRAPRKPVTRSLLALIGISL